MATYPNEAVAWWACVWVWMAGQVWGLRLAGNQKECLVLPQCWAGCIQHHRPTLPAAPRLPCSTVFNYGGSGGRGEVVPWRLSWQVGAALGAAYCARRPGVALSGRSWTQQLPQVPLLLLCLLDAQAFSLA